MCVSVCSGRGHVTAPLIVVCDPMCFFASHSDILSVMIMLLHYHTQKSADVISKDMKLYRLNTMTQIK